VPMAATDAPAAPKAPADNNTSVSRALDDQASAIASDKSAANGAIRPAAQ
jgi:hypothetical protein